MADPRGKVACPKLIDRNNRLQNEKKGFFDALGNIGQLEALNEIGGGNVRKGLSAIAAASNQVRGGTSVVPGNEGNAIGGGIFQSIASTAFDSVEAGATIVLDATGIGRSGLDAANNVNAPVANRALGAAKQIFQSAKQGNFSLSDIPNTFQDLQNLESLVRGIFPGGDKTANAGGLSRFPCQPSPYALDLIQRAPRFKFMYIVDIKFTPAYADYNGIAAGMAFITKSSTRPQVDFEYEEMNLYNYRTHVIKRTIFSPMTMRFIDDQTGTTMRFYELYMKSLSPITNMQPTAPAIPGTYEERSMEFETFETIHFSERLPFGETRIELGSDQPTGVSELVEAVKQRAIDKANGIKNTLTGFFDGNTATQAQASRFSGSQDTETLDSYASTVGALRQGPSGEYPKNMLETITLYHIGNYGDSITSFTMYNPKITSLQPDEVNMADNGDGSELSFEFTYDSLHVNPNQPIDSFGLDTLFNISGGNVGATYPLLPIGTGENPLGGQAKNQPTANDSTRDPGGTSQAKPEPSNSLLPGIPQVIPSIPSIPNIPTISGAPEPAAGHGATVGLTKSEQANLPAF